MKIREILKQAIDSIDTSKKINVFSIDQNEKIKKTLNTYQKGEWHYLPLNEFYYFLDELINNPKERKFYRHLHFRTRNVAKACWETHQHMAEALSKITDYFYSKRTIRFYLQKFKKLGLIKGERKKIHGRIRYCYKFTPLGELFGEFLDFILKKKLWKKIKNKEKLLSIIIRFNNNNNYSLYVYVYSCLIMFRKCLKLKKAKKIKLRNAFFKKGSDTKGDTRSDSIGVTLKDDIEREKYLREIDEIIKRIQKNRLLLANV
ncbi:MAG: hypothetical protein QXI58_00645 [Candidatus Micrarchaeia archaeon]